MVGDTPKMAKAGTQYVQEEESGTAVLEDSKITWRDFYDNRRVLSFCFLIFMLPVNFGYENSMIGKLLAVDAFLQRFGTETAAGELVITARDQQILNAASTVGIFVSAFATGLLSDLLGRKRVIVMACFICVAGILTQYFASTIPHLFGGKVLGSFGFGLGHSLGPVYVAELAPVKLRGVCLALVNTMIVIGQWLSSLVVYSASASYSDDMQWRIPVITQLIPPAVLLAGSFIMPESPSWLILKDRREEAAKAFRNFNGPKFDVNAAMAIMTAAVLKEREITHESKSSSWLDCFRGSNGRRTLIICMVYIAQQFIGVNFISGYLTYYFKLAGVQNALGVAQAAFAIQILGNICSWPLIDRLGRRPMVVGGMIIMTAGLLIIGGISTINNSASLKATVAFMTIWGFLYQSTLGAVAYAVGGETPSPTHRQKTYSINIMTATAVSCAVLQAMPYLINPDQANLGGKICFVFFAPSVPMCVYLYFCLPEMKGRNYVELEEMFQNRVPARKFKGYVCYGANELTKTVTETKGIELENREFA
ncbi:general substrate transporter [Biscogniauxia sp. FL1348]|nr:general substrate transporter [Biscogniauxia sp. FL1348]